jgi:hypothetical protein
MPVEINEMVIKGSIESKTPEVPVKTDRKKAAAQEKAIGKLSYTLRRQIVQECVQEVLDKINLSRGR